MYTVVVNRWLLLCRHESGAEKHQTNGAGWMWWGTTYVQSIQLPSNTMQVLLWTCIAWAKCITSNLTWDWSPLLQWCWITHNAISSCNASRQQNKAFQPNWHHLYVQLAKCVELKVLVNWLSWVWRDGDIWVWWWQRWSKCAALPAS